ncbi:Hsp20/alpha crystallin family protein [Luteolibacter ambystomatis]|uniref:Hsp20/alpha crystallin family protein n=1 Tax=Luteolibacter ambystomatis TaxID=2824561 RepID=A0A975PHE3_9BACT|nr:Hsp20/alpha crystallin family protein [Luteolibacter ambystomatis]QUE53247.1 Hsp20/alpha crystallin family protein [Luteolibacter ambystomatis]
MKQALSAWNPLRELEDFQNRILRAFNPNNRDTAGQSPASTQWSPLVDVSEDEDSYKITAELPQIPKEDVKVTVENGTLVISGERRFSHEDKSMKYHRIERGYGSFARSFNLPTDADPSRIGAKFVDGVLHVQIQKSEHAKPKQIDVRVD